VRGGIVIAVCTQHDRVAYPNFDLDRQPHE